MAQVQLTIHNVFLADILLRKFAELDQLISGGLAGVFHYSGSVNSYDDGIKKKGHGVGMSQYGANNLAKKGYDYYAILKHFYPNTKFAKIKE